MRSWIILGLMVLVTPALAVAGERTSASSETEEPAVLELTKRLRGNRPISPLEESLETVIRRSSMQSGDDGSGDGGFDEPDETVSAPDAPSAEDARFEALQEYVSKHTPLESVQAGMFFLATNPDNPHNSEVRQIINSKASSLSSKEQSDLRAYQAARQSAAGGGTKAAAREMEKWSKRNEANAFSGTAMRESEYLTELAKTQKAEKGQKRSRFLVRIGVVVLVLLLVGVVILGAGG